MIKTIWLLQIAHSNYPMKFNQTGILSYLILIYQANVDFEMKQI